MRTFIDQSLVETYRREGNFKNIYDKSQAVTFAREFFVYCQAPGGTSNDFIETISSVEGLVIEFETS